MASHDPDSTTEGASVLTPERAVECPNATLDGAPKAGASGVREYLVPRNEVEAGVAEILASLAEVERVGANDNFILLGGESLRAAQAARQIWDLFGCEVTLRVILTGTVSDIAEEIAAAKRAAENG